MTDIYDRATEVEEQFRKDAIEEQQRRAQLAAANQWDRLSATHCEADDCGLPIPHARREALPGVKTCVDCARHNEQKNRR